MNGGDETLTLTNEGTLAGDGTYEFNSTGGTVINNGTIAPGSSGGTGSLDFIFANAGTFSQTAGGVLDIGLASLLDFDTVTVSETSSAVNLGGTVRVTSLGGYNPDDGDLFTILLFNPGVRTGTFVDIVTVGFDPAVIFEADYLEASVVLRTTVVPLPGTAWLLVTGCGLIAARRAHRRGAGARGRRAPA